MSYGQDILYKTSDEDITNNDFVRIGIMKNLEILDKIREYLNIFLILLIVGIAVGFISFLVGLVGM